MITSACALHGLEGRDKNDSFQDTRDLNRHRPSKASRNNARISAVIIVEFRDEVYAAIAQLLKQSGLVCYRAESATELAGKVVRHKAELVLLNGTQPDESAWLTSAKLRIIDASRTVWIYTPDRPSALDTWLSMAGIDDIIVYDGVLHLLVDSLEQRVKPRIAPVEHISS